MQATTARVINISEALIVKSLYTSLLVAFAFLCPLFFPGELTETQLHYHFPSRKLKTVYIPIFD